jgi:hypothetical protein
MRTDQRSPSIVSRWHEFSGGKRGHAENDRVAATANREPSQRRAHGVLWSDWPDSVIVGLAYVSMGVECSASAATRKGRKPLEPQRLQTTSSVGLACCDTVAVRVP